MTKENSYEFYQDRYKQELVFHKKYKGYEYFIVDLGTHPTAYVKVPKNSKFFGREYYTYDDIKVHGGLTYSSNHLNFYKYSGKYNWFIGWDYAHAGDYYFDKILEKYLFGNDKKYTLDEIIEDCKSVINQLITKGSDKEQN